MWRHRRVTQWARAAWAEVKHSWRTDSKWTFLRSHALIGWTLFCFAIHRSLGGNPAPEWKKRLRACGRCPVFHRELMTCGKPGQQWFNTESSQMEQRGCLCPLRLKVQLPEATCWSADVGEEDFWMV